MAGQPDVFDAAQNGDLSLLNSHVVMNPECVARRDDRWAHTACHEATMDEAVVEICFVNKIVCCYCCRRHHHHPHHYAPAYTLPSTGLLCTATSMHASCWCVMQPLILQLHLGC